MIDLLIDILKEAFKGFILSIPGAFIRTFIVWTCSGFEKDFKTIFTSGDESIDFAITIIAIVAVVLIYKFMS